MNKNVCKVIAILSTVLLFNNAIISQKPSIVIIIADDFGIGDLNKNDTPFLFELSNKYLCYKKFVTKPRCTPSRMSFLNGYSSARLGVNKAYNCQIEFTGGHLIPQDTTIAEVFNDAGFTTGIIGKWHIGDTNKDHPNNNGYDYFMGSISGMFDYITHVDLCGTRDLEENGNKIKLDKYYTYLVCDHALRFIEKHSDENYFLNINFTAPHAFEQYDDEILKEDDGKNEYDLSDYSKPDSNRHTFMLNSLDSTIKLIHDTIDKNTLFVFFGDNGGDIRYAKNSNGSLKGSKGQSFNGGINTPLIVGKKNGEFIGLNNELFTILDLSKALVKYYNLEVPSTFAGKLNYFNGENIENEFFILNEGGQKKYHDKSAFVGHWKWIERNGQDYLFDWKLDWNEEKNLAEEFPDTLNLVKMRWNEWNASNKYH